MILRETGPADLAAILRLYPLAFPHEDLRGLVTALLTGPHGCLSLAVLDGAEASGHVLFTPGHLATGTPAALLGPLGVRPDCQGAGLGSRLVRAGLTRLATEGLAWAFVLGDPAYYRRFGFAAELRVRPPCVLPPDGAPAWQSLALTPRAVAGDGPLHLPAPWAEPSLWQP